MIKIRIAPSLVSYQFILSASLGYHKKRGALLVGNPFLKQLKKPEPDLPCAQKEVEMNARILNTRPLTGRQATKAEVMKRDVVSRFNSHYCPREQAHGRNCLVSKAWMDFKVPSK